MGSRHSLSRERRRSSINQRRFGFISPADWDRPPEQSIDFSTQSNCICCRPGCACCTPESTSLNNIVPNETSERRSIPERSKDPRNSTSQHRSLSNSTNDGQWNENFKSPQASKIEDASESPIDPFPLGRQYSFAALKDNNVRYLQPMQSPRQRHQSLGTECSEKGSPILSSPHYKRQNSQYCFKASNNSPASPIRSTSPVSPISSDFSPTLLEPQLLRRKPQQPPQQVPQARRLHEHLPSQSLPTSWPFLRVHDQDQDDAEVQIPLDNSALGPLGALINEIHEQGTHFDPHRNVTEMWASWVMSTEGGRPWIRRGDVGRGVGETVDY
jgi:hypothetical protein